MMSKVIYVNEAQSTPINVPDFHPDLLLSGSDKYIVTTYQNGSYHLQIGNYAGIIPAANDYVIQIRPKVAVSDLTYLLLRSGLLNHSLETPFDSTVPYQISGENLESFFEALTFEFLRQIDKIRALGLMRSEKVKVVDSGSVTGRIDIPGTLKIYQKSYGTKIRQKVRECHFSNPENRILAYCLYYLLGTSLRVVSKKDIAKRLAYFSLVQDEIFTASDLSEVKATLERSRIPAQRAYYIPALNLALTILSGTGITIGERSDVTFKPLIINTATMFERYIRNILQYKLRRTWVSVFEGKNQSRAFYSSGPELVNLAPDVIFSIGGKTALILDVKYKAKPTTADHYQVWAYMEGFDLNQAIIVCVGRKLESISKYTRNNREIIVFNFDLSRIKASEEELNDLIVAILNVRTFE